MARIVIDRVSDIFKEKLKFLALKKKKTYRKVVLDAIAKAEGLVNA